MKNRPTIPERPTNAIRNAACAGVVLRTITSSVAPHKPVEVPPVCVRPVKQPAATRRGYLNSSSQRVCSVAGNVAGNAISLGSIIKAQASDLRASSWRSMRISQRGDSGKNPEEHQEQPARDHSTRSRGEDHDAGGERDRDRRPDEHRATANPIAEPPPNEGTRDRAETGGQQDRAALPIGQRPFFGQCRGDVADQEEIEEIEQVSNVSGTDQLPLIGRQPFLPLQKFYHHILPRGPRPQGVAAKQIFFFYRPHGADISG